MALRGSRRISKATRERIEVIAKQIGYRPDPALSSLISYRHSVKPSSYEGALAWINCHAEPEDLAKHFLWYRRGAQERSAELGYKLDEIRMVDLAMDFRRLSKVLRARNIQGVLFPPQQLRKHITKASFEWDDFSCIAFGFSLIRPKLDVVTNAQYRSARLAVRKLRTLGYRRIGLVISRQSNVRVDQNFLAGFLIEQLRLSPAESVPVHYLSTGSPDEAERRVQKWIFRSAPDAILVANWFTDDFTKLETLESAGRNGCGYAFMDVPPDNTTISGINQNNLIIGRTGVDMLVAKINANQRGLPEEPLCILVEGRWKTGTTALRIAR